jgi:hypothetical protein
MACAVPVSVYEQATNNPTRQTQIFKEAYATAVARTLTALRSSNFPDGKQKISSRITRDRKMADIVENNFVGHLSDEQTGGLVILIDQFAKAKPDTQLEDVIISFLLTEAIKRVSQGP